MKMNEYQELARTTSGADSLVMAAMGLSGESGEFIDAIKKHEFHGHELNVAELRKELGDILWYVAEAASVLNIDLNDIAEENINKLRRRYPEGFSSERSVNRSE